MGNLSKTKGLKRLISLLTVVCMMIALIPATVSHANSSDVISVANKLNQLTPAAKSTILVGLLDFAEFEAKEPGAMTAADAVGAVVKALEGQNVIGDGVDQISTDSLLLLANKVLTYRDTILPLYGFLGNSLSKAGLKESLKVNTDLELYNALYSSLAPVVKLNADKTAFQAVDNARAVVKQQLTTYPIISALYADLAITYLFTPREDKDKNPIPSYFDSFIVKINNSIANNGFNVSEVATLLRAYNICEAVTPTPTHHSDGPGGGITPEPSTNPEPTTNPDPAEGTKLLDSTLEAIGGLNIGDASIKAAEAINEATNILANKLTLAEEKALVEKINALVDAVMSKASNQTVNSTVSGTTATAKISDSELIGINKAMDSIVAAAEKLSTVLDASKLDVAVEKVLNLSAQSGENVSVSNFEIPAALMDTAKAKNIDKISLNTDVASFTFSPKAFGDVKEAVTISAAKVEKGAISDQYKEVVGDNIVIDFTVKEGDKTVTNFSKPITVSIPYTLKAGEDSSKITVFFIKDDGSLVNVIGTYDATTKSVVFVTKHFSLYVIKESNVSFADVNNGDWFKNNVEVMASKGIVKGYEDGSFKPQDKITRAEFAALLVRSFNLTDSTAVNSFNDVKSDDWFVGDVAAAAKSGIVAGLGNGTFAPRENISRQDMAVMISRALKVVKNKKTEVSGAQVTFTDASSIDAYAQSDVAAAAKYEIIKGLPGGDFAPKNDATRAEASTMIFRLFFLE